MLNDGVDWLMEQLLANEGESVVYRRGRISDTVSMVFSSPKTPLEDTNGVTFEHSGADFQCRVSDLTLSGSPITPARGDRIERTVNGQTKTYEVQPVIGEQPFTLIADQKFRIHTKLIKVV